MPNGKPKDHSGQKSTTKTGDTKKTKKPAVAAKKPAEKK
jgi:hypothetical protein